MNQMQQSMQTLQQNGLFGAGGAGAGAGGFGGFNPYGGGFGNNRYGGLNFDTLLNNANNNNSFGGSPGGAGGSPFVGFPPVASTTSAPAVDPAVRYASQLRQLQEMGFGDEAANLRALQSTSGNVNAAVERLLGGN